MLVLKITFGVTFGDVSQVHGKYSSSAQGWTFCQGFANHTHEQQQERKAGLVGFPRGLFIIGPVTRGTPAIMLSSSLCRSAQDLHVSLPCGQLEHRDGGTWLRGPFKDRDHHSPRHVAACGRGSQFSHLTRS